MLYWRWPVRSRSGACSHTSSHLHANFGGNLSNTDRNLLSHWRGLAEGFWVKLGRNKECFIDNHAKHVFRVDFNCDTKFVFYPDIGLVQGLTKLHVLYVGYNIWHQTCFNNISSLVCRTGCIRRLRFLSYNRLKGSSDNVFNIFEVFCLLKLVIVWQVGK